MSTAPPAVPMTTLNNGVTIPQLGFGVYKIPEAEVASAIGAAFDAGYRHIDTAQLYANEAGVGAAIAASDIARDELFITTKVWNTDQGFDQTLAAFDASMRRLGLDVLDLYLIHWPVPAQDRYVDTWRALEQLLADGRVRAIGVSNFHEQHLRRLLDETDIVPAINQIELHPRLAQRELGAFNEAHGIVTEAWAPLGRGALMDNTTIASIAGQVGRTPAQVILRWHLDNGHVAIPKSVTPSRIVENIDVFDFALTDEHRAAIDALDDGRRFGPHPDTMS